MCTYILAPDPWGTNFYLLPALTKDGERQSEHCAPEVNGTDKIGSLRF
jgi:hypothetical protein